MKILIVDDDEVARLTLSRILAPLGAQMALAIDGEEAYEQLAAGLRPAVCCSDVAMPRLDGVGLLQRTRTHPVLKDLPFILVSSAADRETVQAAIAAGVAGYMLKPFLAGQARATVDRVLRERRAAVAEHFLVTRRRTGLTLEQLEGVLARLRDDAQGCAEGKECATDGNLQRLHSGASVLGLWAAAGHLSDAQAAGTPIEARMLMLREAGHLIGDQLQSLQRLDPAPAMPAGAAA